MKTDNRKKTSDNPACGAGEKPVIAKGRRVGGEVTQRIANPHGKADIPQCFHALSLYGNPENQAGQSANTSETLKTPEPHPFYALPNHIEDEREYSPSVAAVLVGWIFIVAVVGGGLALWGMT